VEAAKSDSVSSAKMYDALQTSIHDTDQISFKLLGLVPLANGAALLGAVLGIDPSRGPTIIVLSLFAAIVTLGVFWWELRNIRYCLWYIALAERLEATALAQAGVPEELRKRPSAPGNVGKRKAEKLIYSTVVFSWLALPALLIDRTALTDVAWLAYAFATVVVAAGTIWAILTDVDLPPKTPLAVAARDLQQ
jgi:hypothetical protein